jgi:hypothetical protein
MSYRCVDEESLSHNFTIADYARYSHNLNMLHWRNYKASEMILQPTDVTEDSDEEDGYVRSFVVKCLEEDIPEGYIEEIAVRARLIKGWLLADISNTVYYKDTSIPSEWVQRIATKVLSDNQRIEDLYVIQDNPDTNGWVSKEVLPPNFRETIVYVSDLRKRDPRRIIGESYITFLDTLLKLYVEGTIDKVSDSFVNNWELIEDVKYKGLYHPLWTNSLVAPIKSSYLLKVSIDGKPESYRDVVLGPVIDFFGRPKCL